MHLPPRLPAVQGLLRVMSTEEYPGDPYALALSLCEDDAGYKAVTGALGPALRVGAANADVCRPCVRQRYRLWADVAADCAEPQGCGSA
jgi:hypothetical protein